MRTEAEIMQLPAPPAIPGVGDYRLTLVHRMRRTLQVLEGKRGRKAENLRRLEERIRALPVRDVEAVRRVWRGPLPSASLPGECGDWYWEWSDAADALLSVHPPVCSRE